MLAVLAAALADDAGWPIAALLGSTVGIAGIVRIAAGLAILFTAIALRRAPASRVRGALLLGSTILLSVTGALASHAMGRTDGQAWLLTVTALHQAAVGIWVGGLVCAAMLVLRADASAGDVWLRPFSGVAAAAVGGHRSHRRRPFARLRRHTRRRHRDLVRGDGPREDRPLRGAARDGCS